MRFRELLPLRFLGYGRDSTDDSNHFGWLPDESSPSSAQNRLFLRSRLGVDQGDPLAVVLRALTLSQYLMAMRALFPAPQDTGKLHGDVGMVAQYLHNSKGIFTLVTEFYPLLPPACNLISASTLATGLICGGLSIMTSTQLMLRDRD